MDTYGNPNPLNPSDPGDKAILKKLDNGFRRLTWARRQFSQSLLKRFLTKSAFHVTKNRKSKDGSTLYDIIKSGFEHLDSKIGAFAVDTDCYNAFRPILHPIICTLHGCKPKITHPSKSDWTGVDHLDTDMDPDGIYVEKISLRVVRNLKNFPFVPKMTEHQLQTMERDVRQALKSSQGLTGVYYSMSTLPNDVRKYLARNDLVFGDEDKFLTAAGAHRFWPTGRGVFVSHMRDNFVWVNSAEHLTFGIVQKDANMRKAFERMAILLMHVEHDFYWSRHEDTFGYLTFSPALVGSGFKVFVYVKMPYLAYEDDFRNDLLEEYGMECVESLSSTISSNVHFALSNKTTFGITESEILSNVYRCIREIIAIENRVKDQYGNDNNNNVSRPIEKDVDK